MANTTPRSLAPLPPSAHAQRLLGCGESNALFKGGDRAVLPWRRAPQRKGERLATDQELQALMAPGPFLADLDPVRLCATQAWLVSSHVQHYLTGEWERTGQTAADRQRPSNRYPLVKIDQAGNAVLLGGHHRAFAALVLGRPLRARVLRPAGQDALAVLPSLLVGTSTPLAHVATDDPMVAADLVRARLTCLVPDLLVAEAALSRSGLAEEAIDDRLAMATTGRCIGSL